MNAKPRKRRCRTCSEHFQPFQSLQVVCSPGCAILDAKKQERKRLAREKREGRERLKTRRDYEHDAQVAFNAFIRERDKFDGCISCHMPATYQGQWHASHYRSTGAAPELRFDEQNVHKSCAQCNSHKSGNVVEYRLRLIEKIGLAAVERLEGPHRPMKLTVDQLKELRKDYQFRVKLLRASRVLRSMCA